MVLAFVLLGAAAVLAACTRPNRMFRQFRRFGMLGYLAPEPPFARGPINGDARFAAIPISAIRRPLVVACACLLASILLFATGWPLPGIGALLVAALNTVNAFFAARRRRVALQFEEQRRAQPRPPGWFWTNPRP